MSGSIVASEYEVLVDPVRTATLSTYGRSGRGVFWHVV